MSLTRRTEGLLLIVIGLALVAMSIALMVRTAAAQTGRADDIARVRTTVGDISARKRVRVFRRVVRKPPPTIAAAAAPDPEPAAETAVIMTTTSVNNFIPRFVDQWDWIEREGAILVVPGTLTRGEPAVSWLGSATVALAGVGGAAAIVISFLFWFWPFSVPWPDHPDNWRQEVHT